jgi:creatinine amidohydrolase
MKLEEMTSREFAEKVSEKSVIILPIGSIEEHGPHLPLATDCFQPMRIAEMVSRKTGAFIAPFLYYGVCNTTKEYPGTISISFEALRLIVRDILSELVRNGFRNIVVLTGHAGQDHMAALRVAAREIVRKSKVRILVFSDYDIIYNKNLLPPEDGHAGMGETSRIMAEKPRLVRKRPPTAENKMPEYAILDDVRPFWPGWTGDPTKASAALGRKLDDRVASEIVKLIGDMKTWRVK